MLKENQGEVSHFYRFNMPDTHRLADALSILTKDNLNSIRKHLDIRGISTLNKSELIESLAKHIPQHVDKVFKCLNEERYSILKKAVDKGGIIFEPIITLEKAEYFLSRGILFPGRIKGENVLLMPKEIQIALLNNTNVEFIEQVKRNTQFITFAKGLLYYYGAIDYDDLLRVISKYVDYEPKLLDYLTLLFEEIDYDYCIDPSYNMCSHVMVDDPEYVMQEQNRRGEIPYRHFPRKLLIRASRSEFIDRTEEFNDLVDLLVDNYDIYRREAEFFVDECVLLIKEGEPTTDIVNYMSEFFDFPPLDFYYVIAQKINELHNNTRLWTLKRHTPNEAFEEYERKIVKSTDKRDNGNDGWTNIIDMKTRERIRFNSPCPCGSGKEYGMCCGS